MDLKLVGCGFISLASLSFLVFDYLTFTRAEQILTASRQSLAVDTANSHTVTAQNTAKVVQTSAVAHPQHTTTQRAGIEQQAMDEQRALRVRQFAHPTVTGFLRPEGFLRSHWIPQGKGVEISTTAFETHPFTVMLDPGHGGSDPGAVAHNGLLEKHLTLDIAKRTRLYLSKYPNIDVVFTRDTDKGLSRDSRVRKIRNSSADLMISLHFNDLPQTDINLVETYYAGRQNIEESLDKQRQTAGHLKRKLHAHPSHIDEYFAFTQTSRRLAKILQQHIHTEVSALNSGAQNAGVKSDTLFVLTRGFKPGALIEMSCLSNPVEADKLETNEYRNGLSQALATAILEYRKSTINTPLMINTDPNHRSPTLVRGLTKTKHTEIPPGHSV